MAQHLALTVLEVSRFGVAARELHGRDPRAEKIGVKANDYLSLFDSISRYGVKAVGTLMRLTDRIIRGGAPV